MTLVQPKQYFRQPGAGGFLMLNGGSTQFARDLACIQMGNLKRQPTIRSFAVTNLYSVRIPINNDLRLEPEMKP
jgi:hypothetical protein